MNEIHQKIELFLNRYNLNNPDFTYLVAFSGGFDSMCLLDSLRKITPNHIVALHLNHGWRGEESNLEEVNCRKFCMAIGVSFYGERLPETVAKTETAAREARYDFFKRCAEKFNSDIVFTAHNKNDNAETLIYRICKGTGISGLQGISPHRDIYYRPLLEVSRDEVENYCKTQNLTPNSDSSNFNTKYKRNFIRAKVLPMLAEVNPNIVEAINSLSTVAKEETEIVEEYLHSILDKISDGNKIKTPKFLNLSDSIQKRIVYNIFIENNLDYTREKILQIYDFIKENSTSKSGKTCSLTTDLWIFTSGKYIEVIDNSVVNFPSIHISQEGKYETDFGTLEITKCSNGVKTFPKDSESVIYADLNGLDFDFELRTRRDGDLICPYGLSGTQKLKKYLNSKMIPNHEKDNLLFFTQGKEILWAINLGISDKIKVKTIPTHKITWKPMEKRG